MHDESMANRWPIGPLLPNNWTETLKSVELGTYAHSHTYVANNLRRLTHNIVYGTWQENQHLCNVVYALVD